ncbi:MULTISPECIES: hypothetical protein [Streptomyces]|uniref:Uncharacterized protein n=1 Tax=Streptomyces luteosporeus TaxID=173856 RepID=A0ABN3TSW6_9ACTN
MPEQPPQIRLGPPPARPGLPEFPAVVEPAIEDIPAPPPAPAPAEPVAWQRLAVPSAEELLDRAVPAILADHGARSALDGHRYVFLGAARLADAKAPAAPGLFVLAYDYTDERALEFTLADGDPPLLLAMAESAAQPALSPAEADRAVAIARAHSEAARRALQDSVPMVLLTSDVREGDEHHGRRRAYVGFGSPARRMPDVRLVVDLGEERVLGTGGGGDE